MANSHNQHLHGTVVKYWECMHNYAASSMGYALDGCGEFCPTGSHGTPEYFICAACHCHRNFHRKMEIVDVEVALEIPSNHGKSWGLPSQTYDKNTVVATPSPLPMEAEIGGGEIDQVDRSYKRNNCSYPRIRLNPEQREKVKAFAEKVGWRWSKYNEEVKPFCEEIGITPNFLKNWIDNNRRRFGPNKIIY